MDKRNMKALIVNRSHTLRTIIREYLVRAGLFTASSSDNGAAALRRAKSEFPDLIISDFDLRDMTGLDLLREVRQDKSLADKAFIMISSEPEKKFVARAGEFRVNAYVVKPFTEKALMQKVRRVVEQQINPSEGLRCYQEANRLAQNGKVNEALKKYLDALEATRFSMAAVYYKIGWANERLNRDDQAEGHYHEAIDRSERYVDAYDALGALKLKRNEPQAALSYLRKSVDISPLNPHRQFKLAEALMEIGDFEGAEKAYRSSMAMDPRQPHLLNRLAIALRRQGKLKEAREILLHILDTTDGNDENLHYNLGRVHYDLGHNATAAANLEKALEILPEFPEARDLLYLINNEKTKKPVQ